jgi:Gpi18-like mannosyltransferase
MYEKELLQIGFIAGYFMAIILMLVTLYIFACINNKKHEKYLIETKQAQKYKEWEKTQTKRWKYE